MISKALIVAFTLASVVVAGKIRGRCPKKCFCAPKTGAIDCRSAGLDKIPTNLPRPGGIKQLLLSRNIISEIGDELSAYKNLENIDFTGNHVINVSENAFSTLKKLKTLILKKNVITELGPYAFKGLKNLEILDLSDNYLDDVQGYIFKDLKNLRSLLLSHNNIFRFHPFTFFGLDSLTNLDLKGNALEYPPSQSVTKIESLQSLFLGGNKIKKIDTHAFMMLDNLEKLGLENNEIQYVAPYAFHNDLRSDLPKLTYLTLEGNILEVVPVKALRKFGKLQTLDLSGNLFTIIPPDSFNNMTRLQYLNLNELTVLKKIENYAMAGLRSLIQLQIQSCPNLVTIQPFAFQGLKSLRKLQLANNKLKSLPKNLVNWDRLNVLDVSNNPFKCDCSLSWLQDVLKRLSQSMPLLTSCCTSKSPYTGEVMYQNAGAENNIITPQKKGVDLKLTAGLVTGSLILFIVSLAILIYKLRTGLCDPLHYRGASSEALKDAESPVHSEESEPMHKADTVQFANGKAGSPFGSGDVTLL